MCPSELYEVRTDQGGRPVPVLAAKVCERDGRELLLECWSPTRPPAHDSPYLVRREPQPEVALPPIPRLRRPVFRYTRLGVPGPHLLEVGDAGVALDGSALDDDEVGKVLENLDRGLATLEYQDAPTSPQAGSTPALYQPAHNLFLDSTGLQNLLAFEEAQLPVVVVELRWYARLWREAPEIATGLVRRIAERVADRSWYRLEGGRFAKEVSSADEGLAVAVAVARELSGDAAAGYGAVVAFTVDPGQEVPERAARAVVSFPDCSGVLLGDSPVKI